MHLYSVIHPAVTSQAADMNQTLQPALEETGKRDETHFPAAHTEARGVLQVTEDVLEIKTRPHCSDPAFLLLQLLQLEFAVPDAVLTAQGGELGNLSAHGEAGPDTTRGLRQHERASREPVGKERALFILLKSLVLKASSSSVARGDCEGFHTPAEQDRLLLPEMLHADAG